MSKLKFFILIIFFFLSVGCYKHQNSNDRAEKYFLNKVEKLMQKSNKIETDFNNLVPFEWDKVCFSNGKTIVLNFHDLKTNQQHTIHLSPNYNIEEDYVKNSPIRSHYKNKKLSFKNCWKKSTIFVIKKWNTNKKDDLLIQIKGE